MNYRKKEERKKERKKERRATERMKEGGGEEWNYKNTLSFLLS